MKKNIYLIPLFFASISMLLIGCNAHRTNTAETTDGQIALQAPEIKEDVFILYTSQGNGINNEATGFVDPNKHGLYTSKDNIVFTLAGDFDKTRIKLRFVGEIEIVLRT